MASTIPMTDAHENASGHRQPGRRARRRRRGWEAREPTPSMGPGAAKATPGVISEPRQDRAKGLRARCPSRCDWNGSLLRHSSIPTWRSPRSPITWMWRCWNGRLGASTRKAPLGWTGSHGSSVQGQPGNQPGGLTRETRQRHVLSATGRSPTDPQKQRQAATAEGFRPWRTRSWPRPWRCCWRRSTSRISATSPTAFAQAAARITPCMRYGRDCSQTGLVR